MDKKEAVNELNKNLCFFIKSKYFSPFKINGKESSLKKYAAACNLSPSTVSKINKAEGYDIPISTIYLITKFEGDDLKSFFQEFETSLDMILPKYWTTA